MNKKKLVELADEVMVDIDIEMDHTLRQELEAKLCKLLSSVFYDAGGHVRHKGVWPNDPSRKKQTEIEKKAYESVKPVLDDCLNKILGAKG